MTNIEVTSELINSLRQKTELATGGTWSVEEYPINTYTLYSGRDVQISYINGINYEFMSHGLNLLGRLELDWNGKNNLDFIAATGPEVIKALLNEIERLQKCQKN